MGMVVRLWEHTRFRGTRRNILFNEPDLGRELFNDKASSVQVCHGPEGLPRGGGWAKIYRHDDYQGRYLPIEHGRACRDLHGVLGFGDATSTVELGARMSPADQLIAEAIRTVPAPMVREVKLIVKVFAGRNCPENGPYAWVIEDIPNIAEYLGVEFSSAIHSLYCDLGPSYQAGGHVWKAVLYEGVNYQEPSIAVDSFGADAGTYTTLGRMNGKARSIRFLPRE